MAAFLEFVFGVQWWVYVATAIYTVFWLLLRDSYKKDSTSWKRINGWLIQDTWANRYRNTLTRILDAVDSYLSPNFDQVRETQPSVLYSSWTLPLFSVTLLLSLTYPILTLSLHWVATGEAGRIGLVEIFPATEHTITRILFTLGYSASILFFMLWRTNNKLSSLFFGYSSLALNIFFIRKYFNESFLSVSYLCAIPILGLFPKPKLDSAMRLIAVTSAFSCIAAEGTIFSQMFAVLLLLYVTQDYLSENEYHFDRYKFLFFTLSIILIIVAMRIGQAPNTLERNITARSWVLFVGFIPLLNAVADFASTGLTRYCLRQGLRQDQSALKWAAYDLAGAALIFFLLVLSLMAVAEWVRWPGGIALIDLNATLADIRANPADYWWLYITFLSTLLPTALHASVAILAIGLGWFGFLRSFIVSGLKAGAEGDSMWGMSAVWVLAGCVTVSVMIPVLLIGEGIPALPGFGFALLSFFEWIAGLMARV